MRAIRFSWHCQCIKSATVGNISFLLSLSMQRHLLQWQWQLQQGRSMGDGAWQAKVLRDGSKEIPEKSTLVCVPVCVCKGALQLSIVVISLPQLDVPSCYRSAWTCTCLGFQKCSTTIDSFCVFYIFFMLSFYLNWQVQCSVANLACLPSGCLHSSFEIASAPNKSWVFFPTDIFSTLQIK